MYSNFFRCGLWLALSLATIDTRAQASTDTAPSLPRETGVDTAPVDTASTARIVLLARACGDSIVLRWGPSTPMAWQELNRVGYHIERHTILRDGQLLEVPERRMLSLDPIRPRPLPDWKSIVEQDRYAAIAVQALYGKTFEISSANRSDIVRMINKAQEWEQRFSFALFSADISAEAARYAGLRLTDWDVKANEKYLYKIFSAQPTSVPLDTGLVFLSPGEQTELPVPVDVTATFDDRRVMLKWNKYYHEATYMAYQVERSTDGTSFVPITDLPITFARSTEQPNHYMFKTDSLPRNGITYYYRVSGITPFGEVGPPSDVISGQGYQALRTPPSIVQAELTKQGAAAIQWEVDEASAPLVRHFSVEKASNVSGSYHPVAVSLAHNTRTFTDPKAEGTHYYRVTGYGAQGETVHSFPVLLQAEDSIPPTTPSFVQGQIDTTGQVTLRWPASPEHDILGYRIFRSNRTDRDFIQITREPTADTVFVDQINLDNLTKDIYYKVSAVDQRFNPSSLSAAAALQKPDMVPPVTPILKTAYPRPEGIKLAWMGSPSEDIAHYLIYRRKPEEASWQLAGTASDTVRYFLDQTVAPSQAYEYLVLAVDESKLESTPTAPLRVTSRATPHKKIEHTYAEANHKEGHIFVQWDYPNDGVRAYHVYRAEADTVFRLYHNIDAPVLQFIDERVKPSETYHYRIKAVYTNGSQSPLSDEVLIQY